MNNLVKSVTINTNTGTCLIGEGDREALRSTKVTYLPTWCLTPLMKDKGRPADLKRNFDMFAFVAANILRNDYDAVLENDILEEDIFYLS